MRSSILLVCLLCTGVCTFAAVGERESRPEGSATVPILIFHSVRPYLPTDTPGMRSYIATPETLDAELAYLRANDYTSISFDDLAAALILGTSLPPRPVMISFDDGWESQYVYGLPLLRKYSFKATFFIYTNAVGVPHYMSWDQILALSADGMQIGCHSKSHPYLNRIRDEHALQREIVTSKQVIEAHLGKPVTAFAYPFGQYNQRVVDVVKAAGFISARGTRFGVLHAPDEIFTLTGLIRTASRTTLLEAIQAAGRGELNPDAPLGMGPPGLQGF